MSGYRSATPFSAGNDTAAAVGLAGSPQFFSIDFLGHVQYIDYWLVGAVQPVDLQFPGTAKCLAAARMTQTQAGPRTTMFVAGMDNRIYRWQKDSNTPASWQPLPEIPKANATDLFSIRSLRVGYNLAGPYIVALCHVLQRDDSGSQLAFFELDGDTWFRYSTDAASIGEWIPRLMASPGQVDNADCNGIFASCQLADGRTGVAAWMRKQGNERLDFLPGSFTGFANPESGGYGTHAEAGIFAVCTSDSTLRWLRLFRSAPTGPLQFQTKTIADSFAASSLAAVLGSTAITVFALGADQQLHVFAQNDGPDVWNRTWAPRVDFVGEQRYTRLVEAEIVGLRQPRAYMVNHNHMLDIVTRDVDRTWLVAPAMRPAAGTVEELPIYSTRILFYGPGGLPVPFVPVTLSSESLVRLEINGAACELGEGNVWTGTAGADGRLVLHIPAGNLGVPVVSLWTAGMPQDDRIDLHVAGLIEAQLSTLTGDQLAAGVPAAASRSRSGLDSVASAIRDLMTTSINQRKGARQHAFFHPIHDQNVATYVVPSARNQPSRSTGPAWQLTMQGDEPVFQTLDGAPPVTRGPRTLGWTSGDLLSVLADGVGALVTMTAADVAAAATFVVNGVTYAVRSVIHAATEAFHYVRGVLQRIGVKLTDLWNWLVTLFEWGDIKRSRDVAKNAILQGFDLTEQFIAIVRNNLDARITAAQARVTSSLDAYIASLAPGTTLGGKLQQIPQRPVADDEALHRITGRNPFQAGLAHHSGGPGGIPGITLDAAGAQSLTNLRSALATLPDNLSAPGLDRLNTLLSSAYSVDVLSVVVADLLSIIKDLVEWSFGLARAVVNGLLDALTALVRCMRAALTAPLEIPFLSALYRKVAGDEMSILDLLCIALAIPATALYKRALGTAPFPTEASVTQASQYFSAATVLSASGLGPAAGNQSRNTPDTPRQAFAYFFRIMATLNGALFAVADTVVDTRVPSMDPDVYVRPALTYYTRQGASELASTRLSRFCWGASIAGWVFTCPWVAAGHDHPGFGSADQLSGVIWIGQVLGIGHDAFWLFDTGSLARNAGNVGVGLVVAWGVINLGFQIALAVMSAGQDAAGVAGGFLSQIPVIGKGGRLMRVILATEGVSIIAGIALDAACGFGVLVCDAVEADHAKPGSPGHALA